MKKDLIEIIDREAFADSQMIARKFGVEHKKVVRTIERLIDKLSNLRGTSCPPTDTLKVILEERNYRGQYFKAYMMDRAFFSFLAMRFETDRALIWQVKFIDRFFEYEKRAISAQLNKSDELWTDTRAVAKADRLEATDAVQSFIAYARASGSKNCDRYYLLFTNMAYNTVGLEYKQADVRDVLNTEQLKALARTELKQAVLIRAYMDEGLPYKKIFKKVKRQL